MHQHVKFMHNPTRNCGVMLRTDNKNDKNTD